MENERSYIKNKSKLDDPLFQVTEKIKQQIKEGRKKFILTYSLDDESSKAVILPMTICYNDCEGQKSLFHADATFELG